MTPVYNLEPGAQNLDLLLEVVDNCDLSREVGDFQRLLGKVAQEQE